MEYGYPAPNAVAESFAKALKARLLYEDIAIPKQVQPERVVHEKHLAKYGVTPVGQKISSYPVAEVRNAVFRQYRSAYARNARKILVKKSEIDVPQSAESNKTTAQVRAWAEARSEQTLQPTTGRTVVQVKKNRRYFSVKLPQTSIGYQEGSPQSSLIPQKAKYLSTPTTPTLTPTLLNNLLRSQQFGGTRPARLRPLGKSASGEGAERKSITKPPKTSFKDFRDLEKDAEKDYHTQALRSRTLRQV